MPILAILAAVAPPLFKALADLIEQWAAGRVDHAQVLAAMQKALSDADASLQKLKADFAASDADFEAKLKAHGVV